jgi:hypothetical protein
MGVTMSEISPSSESKVKLKALSRIRRIAELLLDGPRALMFPDDPKGLRLWLEPGVCLKSHSTTPKKSEALNLYSVPNCLERDRTSPVVLRHTIWESESDKGGNADLPTTSTSYWQLPVDQLAIIDGLLRYLDESLKEFPFSVEGLDLDGASGFKPLPNDAVIVTGSVRHELWRTTRFSYAEIHWIPTQSDLSKLDKAWTALFDTLISITHGAGGLSNPNIVEKYDIDPWAFGEFLKSAF